MNYSKINNEYNKHLQACAEQKGINICEYLDWLVNNCSPALHTLDKQDYAKCADCHELFKTLAKEGVLDISE